MKLVEKTVVNKISNISEFPWAGRYFSELIKDEFEFFSLARKNKAAKDLGRTLLSYRRWLEFFELTNKTYRTFGLPTRQSTNTRQKKNAISIAQYREIDRSPQIAQYREIEGD